MFHDAIESVRLTTPVYESLTEFGFWWQWMSLHQLNGGMEHRLNRNKNQNEFLSRQAKSNSWTVGKRHLLTSDGRVDIYVDIRNYRRWRSYDRPRRATSIHFVYQTGWRIGWNDLFPSFQLCDHRIWVSDRWCVQHNRVKRYNLQQVSWLSFWVFEIN